MDFTITAIHHLIDRRTDDGWQMEESVLAPNLYIMGLAQSGAADYTINGTCHRIEAGDLVFLTPGTRRSAHSAPEDPWHMLSIGFTLDFADPADREAFGKLPVQFSNLSPTVIQKSKSLLTAWNSTSANRMLQVRSALYVFLFTLLESQNENQSRPVYFERIERVQAHILQHYANAGTQKELAELCGYSESHFRKLFRAVTGMSCSDYILSVRMDVARNLLRSGTANVSETARLTGFSDIYQFSKSFKKYFGHSPSRYKS